MFVLICAGLLLIVLAAVGLPLLSGSRALPSRGQYDQAVYRDQLGEVERDLARGVLTPEEAGGARLEIQRRLLAADAAANAATKSAAVPSGTIRSPRLAALVMLFVVVCAGGLYWHLGAPALSDVPFASRTDLPAETPSDTADAQANVRQAADRLEQKLRDDPSNGDGWILFARTESLLGDWAKAADAYKHAIDLGLKSGEVFAGYGEMQVMAADGVVSPAAPPWRAFIWRWPTGRQATSARPSRSGWNWRRACLRTHRCGTKSPAGSRRRRSRPALTPLQCRRV
jgi:cytochrome c-type biogenesis protein CcmH